MAGDRHEMDGCMIRFRRWKVAATNLRCVSVVVAFAPADGQLRCLHRRGCGQPLARSRSCPPAPRDVLPSTCRAAMRLARTRVPTIRNLFPASQTCRTLVRSRASHHPRIDPLSRSAADPDWPDSSDGCGVSQGNKRRFCTNLRGVPLGRIFNHRKTLRFKRVLVNRARALRFLKPLPDKASRGICIRQTTDRSVRKTTC
jgi:hypothetical protein